MIPDSIRPWIYIPSTITSTSTTTTSTSTTSNANINTSINTTNIPKEKATHKTRKITPGNYDAIEINKAYGLIHIGQGVYNEDNFIIHTRVKDDKTPMLSIQMGDTIIVTNLKTRKKETLTVRYTTRSRYYSPGVMINTIHVGVDGWCS